MQLTLLKQAKQAFAFNFCSRHVNKHHRILRCCSKLHRCCYVLAPTFSGEEFVFLFLLQRIVVFPFSFLVSLTGGLISVCHHVEVQTWSQPASSSRTWRHNQSPSLLHPDLLKMILGHDAVQNVSHCPDVDKVSLRFGSGWTCFC